jgi:hypothetical protein
VTGAPAAQPGRDELTLRVFRVLYAEFDLHTASGLHVVVPRGTPWFAGPSLGEIARQISEHEHPQPDQPPCGRPAEPGSQARRPRGPAVSVVSAAVMSAAGRRRSPCGGR